MSGAYNKHSRLRHAPRVASPPPDGSSALQSKVACIGTERLGRQQLWLFRHPHCRQRRISEGWPQIQDVHAPLQCRAGSLHWRSECSSPRLHVIRLEQYCLYFLWAPFRISSLYFVFLCFFCVANEVQPKASWVHIRRVAIHEKYSPKNSAQEILNR